MPPSGSLGHAHDPSDEPVIDCSATLLRLYEYLDGEMVDDDGARIRAHLDECVECLQAYQADIAVKAAVKRACGCQEAPVQLRQSIMARISITTVRWE